MEMIGCHINKRETRIKEGKCFFFFLSGKNRLRKFFSREHAEFWRRARDFGRRSGCHFNHQERIFLSLHRLVFYIVFLFSLDLFFEILIFD